MRRHKVLHDTSNYYTKPTHCVRQEFSRNMMNASVEANSPLDPQSSLWTLWGKVPWQHKGQGTKIHLRPDFPCRVICFAHYPGGVRGILRHPAFVLLMQIPASSSGTKVQPPTTVVTCSCHHCCQSTTLLFTRASSAAKTSA